MTSFSPEYTALSPTVRPLLDWYRASHRALPWRDDPTPYHVWISEIMLQQTRVAAVLPYYARFLKLFPDVRALANADEEVLLKAWEGLGYYSRARNLQKAAKQIAAEGGFPVTYEGWLSLPGIGPYTAGAICSIACSLPYPAVDGNVLRVYSRLLALDADVSSPPVKKRLTALAASLLPDENPGDYNQALMELGATVCLPNGKPLCESCPIAAHCKAYADGDPAAFPLRPAKKPRPVLPLTVFVIRDGQGRIALQKRPDSGLLAGLWQFPNSEGQLSEKEALSFLRKSLPDAVLLGPLPAAKHIFTHLQWQMTGWLAQTELVLSDAPFVWVDPEEMEQNYSLPSAFSSFLPFCDVQNQQNLL